MYFFILAGIAFLAGITINNILRKITVDLLEETEHFEDTSDSFFKQMKLRYENCLKIGHGINNTEAFAGKYLDKYKHKGISINGYEKLSGIMAGASVIFGICGALFNREFAMEYLLCGFLGMYIVTGYGKLLDVPGKRKRITLNIVDYFENRFYTAASMETHTEVHEDKEPEIKVSKEVSTVSSEERKLIDEILREYLG